MTMTTAEAMVYSTIIFIVFGIILLVLFFTVRLEIEDRRNEEGRIIGLDIKRYLKIFLIAIEYPLVMELLNLMNAAATYLATVPQFEGVIGFLFEVMLYGSWAWALVMIIWAVLLTVSRTKLKRTLESLGNLGGGGEYE